jgi:hypothetical protein
MRSIKVLALVALLALSGSLSANRADALPLPGAAAAAIGAAANEADARQNVAYVCRRVWRCGPRGCGWRRVCYWTPGPFVYAYPYGYPYWGGFYWGGYPRYWARPYWRGRTWRGRRYWR